MNTYYRLLIQGLGLWMYMGIMVSVFAQQSSIDSSLLSSYRLATGDTVNISVFGEPNFSVSAHLTDAGTISYPFLGELQVSGLTIGELEQLITKGLKGDYLVDPKVTVSITEYRKFFISGEVRNPGSYAFVPGYTVHKAVSMAGGFTERASRTKINIIRGSSQSPQRVDLDEAVQPGDIITVEESFW